MAGRASLLSMLRRRLEEVETSCARLIEDGGTSYDRHHVNPATVLQVLTGDERAGGPVVPSLNVSSVVVVLISHGHAHEASKGSPHHEWYMHFPHPVPPQNHNIYDVIAHHYDPVPDWDWGSPKHLWRLYSQNLFQAHHEVLRRAPQRRLLLFHQFCLSGGAVNFMRQHSYWAYCGTYSWPVFGIVTAGRFEPALGSFVGMWTNEFVAALRKGGDRTLGDVFKAAQTTYWEAHPEVDEMNKQTEIARSRIHESQADESQADGSQSKADQPQVGESTDREEISSVGTVGREAGIDGASRCSMDDVPVWKFVNFVDRHS